jgi:hypothetical protein
MTAFTADPDDRGCDPGGHAGGRLLQFFHD